MSMPTPSPAPTPSKFESKAALGSALACAAVAELMVMLSLLLPPPVTALGLVALVAASLAALISSATLVYVSIRAAEPTIIVLWVSVTLLMGILVATVILRFFVTG
jgi:hypothetical protein